MYRRFLFKEEYRSVGLVRDKMNAGVLTPMIELPSPADLEKVLEL